LVPATTSFNRAETSAAVDLLTTLAVNLSYGRCLGDSTLSAFQKAGLPSVAQPESCKTATVTKWRSSVAFSIFSVPVIRSSPFLHSNFNRFQSLPAKSRIDRDVISALEVVVGNGSVTAKQLGALDDVHHLDAGGCAPHWIRIFCYSESLAVDPSDCSRYLFID
jgi:hypothetical protein